MDFINEQLLLHGTNCFYWGLFANVKAILSDIQDLCTWQKSKIGWLFVS